MDQKLLDALNNLSDALQLISDALGDKKTAKSPTAQALQSGDFSKQIIEINTGIKSIKKDTQEILKQQKTILAISQKKDADKKTGLFEESADKKSESNLKKGVGVIVLIAVAVLAIGMAFKLIGKIDFLSVVALGTAIVLISIAFERVAKLNITTKQAFDVSKMLVIVSLAIALSSYALRMVAPISLAQAVTAILIGAMFSVVAFGISKMLTALGGANMMTLGKSILALPIILPAIAAGIALSSWVLKLVAPISLAQAFTAIMIAAAFAVISFGLGKMIGAFKDIDPATLLAASVMIPIILPALAFSIAVSSWALSTVKPIGFAQFMTALGISILFIAMSFAVSLIAKSMKNIGLDDVVILPLLFITLSTAVYLSSLILAKSVVVPNDKLFSALKIGILMAGVSLLMTPAFWLMNKLGIGIKEALVGSLVIVAMATTIMLSSLILSVGSYGNFPSLGWTLGVAASLLVFSVGAIAIGALVMSGVGAVAMLAGAAAILVVAATVVAAAAILNKGDYSKYPSFDWAKGVALTMTTFGIASMTLGGFILGTLGLGGLALSKGSDAVKGIAQTIVDTAVILKKGDFTGGPNQKWAEGISLALGAFSPIYAMLMGNGVMKAFGGGGIGPEDFSKAIKTISEGILYSATLFKGTEGIFQGGPSKSWAEGVGTAISAFAPVYKILVGGAIMDAFGVGGVSVDAMKSAILTISQGIVDAAGVFSSNTATFDEGKYPSATWGSSVAAALSAFSPVYEAIAGKSWYQSSGDAVSNLTNGVKSMAEAIASVAISFSAPNVSWTVYPDKEWAAGIAGAVKSYITINDYLADKVYDDSVVRIARKLVKVAQIMSAGPFVSNIDPNFMKNMQSNVFYYVELTKKLNESSGGLKGLVKGGLFGDPITNTANGMVKLANAYDKMSNSLVKFGQALGSIDASKVATFRNLNNGIMNTDANSGMGGLVNSVGSAVGSVVGGIGDAVGGFLSSVGNLFGGSSDSKPASISTTPGSLGKYGDSAQQLDAVIELLTKLNESTKSLDIYIKEQQSKNGGKSATAEK